MSDEAAVKAFQRGFYECRARWGYLRPDDEAVASGIDALVSEGHMVPVDVFKRETAELAGTVVTAGEYSERLEARAESAEAELVVLREQLAGAATLLRDLHSFTMRHMAHSRWYHELPVADARAFLAGLENRGGSR